MIEPAYASRMAPVVFRAITNGTFDAFTRQNRESAMKVFASYYAGMETEKVVEDYNEPSYYTATAKNGLKVAIVPLMGAITKNGDACSWGWRDYQNILSRIEKNPNIAGLVVHFNNTPGGSHDGTPEMASSLAKYTKPNLAFGDGYVASAHYYAASQMQHIMANKLTPTEFGSIGSLILWQNVQNMIEKGEYPQMEIIRAPQSTDKALENPIEPLTDELRAGLLEELRTLTKVFIADVKRGRGDKLTKDENVFTGKMYTTEEAIANGLADSKGTLQDAINKVAEMAKQKSTSAPSKSGQVNSNMKFPKLSALFSGEAWSKAYSAFAEDHAPLEAAEKKVADMEASVTQLKTDNDRLMADVSSKATKVTELEATVTGLQARVSTLEGENKTLASEKTSLQEQLANAPTAAVTTVISSEEKNAQVNADQGASATAPKYETSIDREAKAIREQQEKNATIK